MLARFIPVVRTVLNPLAGVLAGNALSVYAGLDPEGKYADLRIRR